MPDAEKQGKRWFCSPSCLLRAESNLSSGQGTHRPDRGPIGVVRRIVKWTLIVVGLLVVLGIVGAVLGLGDSKPTATVKSHRAAALSAPRRVRFGWTAAVGGGWYLRIKSVNWNAASAISAVDGQYGRKPRAHAREVMPTVAFSYREGGQANVTIDFADRVYAIGKHKAAYSWVSGLNACGPGSSELPPPDAQTEVEAESNVFSGTTISGHICFEIAANDVSTLRLYVKPPETYPPSKRRPVYFALR